MTRWGFQARGLGVLLSGAKRKGYRLWQLSIAPAHLWVRDVLIAADYSAGALTFEVAAPYDPARRVAGAFWIPSGQRTRAKFYSSTSARRFFVQQVAVRQAVALMMRERWRGRPTLIPWATAQDWPSNFVRLDLTFTFLLRREGRRWVPRGHGDLRNHEKALEDALQPARKHGGPAIYANDRVVTDTSGRARYAPVAELVTPSGEWAERCLVRVEWGPSEDQQPSGGGGSQDHRHRHQEGREQPPEGPAPS